MEYTQYDIVKLRLHMLNLLIYLHIYGTWAPQCIL